MTPVPARLSSSVILVRKRAELEVLMVVRNSASYFASALVFPGGTVDAEDRDEHWRDHLDGADGLSDDERAIRIAGFREVYEETGLLLVERAEHAPREAASFRDVVARAGARLDLSAMYPFAHWITPASSPKRYDTHFRLCGLSTELTAVSDGRETVSVEWLSPAEAIRLGAARERTLLFPTRANLELLAQSQSVDAAVATSRQRQVVTVEPTVERRSDGTYITIPRDAGYGAAEEFVGAPPKPEAAKAPGLA